MLKKDLLQLYCCVNLADLIKTLLTFFILFFCSLIYSQADCYLGIGGKDDETIQKVFRLDSVQVEKMKNWGAELKYRNSFLINKANNLLKRHAESSPEVLMTMSYQYKKLLDSMQGNLRMLDKRMLGIFNEEQYNLYMVLCNQISNSPLYPTVPVNEK
ncbi:hypothetical protein MTsPCn9_00580 [Croceitalea sp. MTPC9]|uniref:hypothetical protein n=1 Tax=unclassified Croceitalea TaxID=2632280 RepID=UPI002B3BD442|nr:hypothetical protein MTsPCn6_08130 [Croceitalea sp. MTPC6]GMN15122.1 hypothetical protein MTsPCn9_00580 [Croceitalea sp. MTPC9]